MRIYDNTFLQAISCPLKVYHIALETSVKSKNIAFRHRNKLRLRDVISLQFKNRRFTSDSIQEAEKETADWLKEENVAICGAVVRAGNFITRIPILVKENDQFTIVQVHGKLRKRMQHDEIHWPVKSRSTASYLMKAAYRSYVLMKGLDILSPKVTLFFPNKSYRSVEENLLQMFSGIREKGNDAQFAFDANDLFASVDATESSKRCMGEIPESVSHSIFTGMSVEDACTFMVTKPLEKGNILDIGIHRECKYCDFRRVTSDENTGCWNRFFPDQSVELPDLHVYELIGHGNDEDSDRGFFYQEQVPATEPYSSFRNIRKNSGDKFSIYQRRMLQLLNSKGSPGPKLWVRSGLTELREHTYPLHFLDFEAATYALPLERGEHPYNPVYFQYSCHTLHEDGRLEHHFWLDEDAERSQAHESLIDHLASVPGIREGSIIQYSQFEYRAMKNILKGFRKNANLHEKRIRDLTEIMKGSENLRKPRFLDLSRIIEEYYYNYYMRGSIGLKHVLKSVLMWQKEEQSLRGRNPEIYDSTVDLYHPKTPDGYPDPYSSLSLEGKQIGDGSEAMNAWLSLKNGLLNTDESVTIPLLLKRYCALDSYALVILFRHLVDLLDLMNEDEDLIILKDLDNTGCKP
jgi:hypothetical protein